MVNCRLMNGADWKAMGWAEYQTLLAAWNDRHSDDAGKSKGVDDPGRLRAFFDAHSNGGNG